METSSDFSSLVSNNCYESHALYNLLENIKSGPVTSPPSQLKIELVHGESYSKDHTIYLN